MSKSFECECVVCGKTFAAAGPRGKFCGAKCRQTGARTRGRASPTIVTTNLETGAVRIGTVLGDSVPVGSAGGLESAIGTGPLRPGERISLASGSRPLPKLPPPAPDPLPTLAELRAALEVFDRFLDGFGRIFGSASE